MLKAAKYFSILFATFFLFTTCKKYPEGGFEKRGPVVLLKHNGAWTLTLYEVNGIDSTDLINYNGNERYKEVSFYKEDTPYNPHLYGENYPAAVYLIEFTNNNTKLSFRSDGVDNTSITCFSVKYSGCYRLFFNPEGENNMIWEILKLTKKELILISTRNNTYKLKFKPR